MSLDGLFLSNNIKMIHDELAMAYGVNGAMILQQIYYWTLDNRKGTNEPRGNLRDGVYWTYKTYEDWQLEFPFWGVRTIRRLINKLEENGAVISTNKYNTHGAIRTKWYAINPELSEYREVNKVKKHTAKSGTSPAKVGHLSTETTNRDYKKEKDLGKLSKDNSRKVSKIKNKKKKTKKDNLDIRDNYDNCDGLDNEDTFLPAEVTPPPKAPSPKSKKKKRKKIVEVVSDIGDEEILDEEGIKQLLLAAKRKTNNQLEKFWLENKRLIEPQIGILKPLKGKERSMLGHVWKGLVGFTDESRADMIAFAMHNWRDFTFHCKEEEGLESLPDKLSVAFLATHANCLTTFAHDYDVAHNGSEALETRTTNKQKIKSGIKKPRRH